MLQSLIEIQQQLLTGIVTLNLPERKTSLLTNKAESVLAGLKALQALEEITPQSPKCKEQPAPVANKKQETDNKKPKKK